MRWARLAGSALAMKERYSSDVGSTPQMSMLARRRNSSSLHNGEGLMRSLRNLTLTSSSIVLAAGGLAQAKESPFGTTIAHGNLTLSMIDGFREGLLTVSREAFPLGVNLGWNRVRFPAPVPAGSRIRASAELVSSEEKDGGWIEAVTRFTLELEGGDKPCCVADSVTRLLRAPAD